MTTIPRSNETYKLKEYWNERFTEEEHYEWLESFESLRKHLTVLLKLDDKILVIGCGNSNLSSDLYDAGYRNITSLDYSETVINKLTMKHRKARPEMQWVCNDMRNLEKVFSVEAEKCFNVIIDKAGMDALLTDQICHFNPNPETAKDCHKILKGVSTLLKPGGHFVQITFNQPHFHRRYIEGSNVDFEVKFERITQVYSALYNWKGTVTELKDETKFSNFLWILQKA